MKPFCRIIIILCLQLLLCGPVFAQHTGPYVGGFLGGNLLADSESSDNQGSFNLSFKPALQGSVVLGWDLALNSALGEGRVELEYSRRSNPLDQVEFAEGKFNGSGDLTADSLLFNCIGVVRDAGRWAPYVIAGIGAARINADALQVSGQPLSNDKATVFAYQVGAGVEYALTGSFTLDLGYRFFSTSRPEFAEAGGRKFSIDYLSNSVMLGLRVGF